MYVAPTTKVGWCLGTPQKRRVNLFGNKPVGIYKDFILGDVCPHRGASLIKGKESPGCVSCPYHGWQFSEGGQLMEIPTSDTVPLFTSDVPAYDYHEENGLVWTTLDNDPLWQPVEVPEFQEPGWKTISGCMEVKGNWLKWIENAADLSHINFVHEFGDPNRGRFELLHMIQAGNTSKCAAIVNPQASNLLTEKMQPRNGGGAYVNVDFHYPNTTVIRLTLREPYKFITYSTVTPLGRDTSLISWVFGYNFFFSFGDMYFHRKMEETIRQDERIIQDIPQRFHNSVHCRGDAFQNLVVENLKRKVGWDPLKIRI